LPAARQRARLAAAAACASPVLLLDRPCAGLDDAERDRVAAWVVEMRDAGRAIVISGAGALARLDARPLDVIAEAVA
jgi:ABC-type sulfate/molybdate transport systems ATPase subunit